MLVVRKISTTFPAHRCAREGCGEKIKGAKCWQHVERDRELRYCEGCCDKLGFPLPPDPV